MVFNIDIGMFFRFVSTYPIPFQRRSLAWLIQTLGQALPTVAQNQLKKTLTMQGVLVLI